MKKRQKIIIFTLFLVGLGILSLPLKRNIAIRNRIADSASSLWRLVSFQASPHDETESIDEWLMQAEARRIHAQKKALFLTPNNQTYLVGKVLYRAINSYNSSLWIDLGSDSNSADLPQIIAKNSPVLSGDSVIGVIDYVGSTTSLVRLITDPGLTPAVRVLRQTADKELSFAIYTIKKALKKNNTLLKTDERRKALQWLLHNLSEELNHPQKPLFLAKGILQGQGEPLWRAPSLLLKGSGFNYDFADSHGPARDLRTGEVANESSKQASPLIRVGDLLVTSGMDGVFPEGLKIATVHSIKPLSEGAYAYELLASPTAKDLMDLQYVTVLPPQGFDLSSTPEPIDKLLQQLQ